MCPGTPQTAGSFAVKYAGPGYLFLEASINYYDNSYLDFNPDEAHITGYREPWLW